MPTDIDELLDRAFAAISAGDHATAAELAGRVLAVEPSNVDAGDLLSAPLNAGDIRRLTIIFADLVESTSLSRNLDPEAYRRVVGRYRDIVTGTVNRYEGHISSTKGDGLLAMFGHPIAHENDIHRAVRASLDITRDVARLSAQARSRFGIDISVRVGVHRGVVYLDTRQDDVYGLAANLAARVAGLAAPGTVVVSSAIERLIHREFELEARPPTVVKGIDKPVEHYRVIAPRSVPAPGSAGALIGRERELAELTARWERTLRHTPGPVGIALLGEAGLGKSRLAAEAIDMAQRSGHVALTLFGSALHQDAGLYPIRALLERRCGIEVTSDPARRLELLEAEVHASGLDSAATVPLLARVLGVPAGSGHAPVQADGRILYEQIRETVGGYLISCLQGEPGLIVAEDVQWFDSSSLDVLLWLLEKPRGSFSMVITGREGAGLPSTPNIEVHHLTALSDTETDDLILALEPTMPAPERGAVARRCDGVPLYIEEVVKSGRVKDDEAWSRVPDALYEPLFARLRAGATALPVVEAAATIGREVDLAVLSAVTGLADDVDLKTALAELEFARVLEPSGETGWRFRHELLREVASELAPPSRRRQLHGQIGDALMTAPQPEWPLAARHYEAAERFDDAAVASQRAAGGARRRGALDEAHQHLTRSLEQLGQLPPGASRRRREVNVLLRRGLITSAIAGPQSPDAAADFEQCLELNGTDLTYELFAAMTALFGHFITRSDMRRAEQLLDSVRTGLGDHKEWFRPVNDTGFATVAWYRGDFDTARRQFEALAVAPQSIGMTELSAAWFMPYEPVASVYTHAALARFIHGDLAGAEARLADTEKRCEELGFPHGPFSLAYSRFLEVLIRLEAGQLDRAAAVVAAQTVESRRHGFDSWITLGVTQAAATAALAALRADDIGPAALEEHALAMATAQHTLETLGTTAFLPVYQAISARLELALGRHAQARGHLDAALNHARTTGVRFYEAELLRLRAATMTDVEARREALTEAIDLAHHQGARIFELRCAADLFELCGEEGRESLAGAVAEFDAESDWPQLTPIRALLR